MPCDTATLGTSSRPEPFSQEIHGEPMSSIAYLLRHGVDEYRLARITKSRFRALLTVLRVSFKPLPF